MALHGEDGMLVFERMFEECELSVIEITLVVQERSYFLIFVSLPIEIVMKSLNSIGDDWELVMNEVVEVAFIGFAVKKGAIVFFRGFFNFVRN